MTAVDAVDVVVVGAGIAGASAAAELSATRRVVLIEREHLPAQHASGRSASVLSETSGHPDRVRAGPTEPTVLRVAPRRIRRPPVAAHRAGSIWVGEAG